MCGIVIITIIIIIIITIIITIIIIMMITIIFIYTRLSLKLPACGAVYN